jgi:hypothetical protein
MVDAAVAVVTTKVFFNILQAARFLGVSPFWIEEMCRQGRLPSDAPEVNASFFGAISLL